MAVKRRTTRPHTKPAQRKKKAQRKRAARQRSKARATTSPRPKSTAKASAEDRAKRTAKAKARAQESKRDRSAKAKSRHRPMKLKPKGPGKSGPAGESAVSIPKFLSWKHYAALAEMTRRRRISQARTEPTLGSGGKVAAAGAGRRRLAAARSWDYTVGFDPQGDD